MFNRNTYRLLLLAALVLPARMALALPEDQQQPIHITADSAVQENTVVTYKGNVLIVQGTIRIDADQVVIYHEKGKLQRAVATGKPAHFQEQPEADGGLITGSANTLVYYNADQRVELLQNAFVDRDKSTVKGSKIEYLLPSKTVRAEGASATQSGRVEMVLQPNQKKPEDTQKTDEKKPEEQPKTPSPSSSPAPVPASPPTSLPPARKP